MEGERERECIGVRMSGSHCFLPEAGEKPTLYPHPFPQHLSGAQAPGPEGELPLGPEAVRSLLYGKLLIINNNCNNNPLWVAVLCTEYIHGLCLLCSST